MKQSEKRASPRPALALGRGLASRGALLVGGCVALGTVRCEGASVGVGGPSGGSVAMAGSAGETPGGAGAPTTGAAGAGGSSGETSSAGALTGTGGTAGSSGGGGERPADSCSDGETNHGESDKDCGGPCDPCGLGSSCNYDIDCETQSCVFGICEQHLYMASVNGEGEACNDASYHPHISGDGRVIAYEARCTNFFGDEKLGGIVVHDRLTGTVERASVSVSGVVGYGSEAKLSGDGQVVAFRSSNDLVEKGDSTAEQVFVYDRATGSVERISETPSGAAANSSAFSPSLSSDGNLAVFRSAATNLGSVTEHSNVYLRNRSENTVTALCTSSSGTPANDSCSTGKISPDGSHVVFSSGASNLVSDDTNGLSDIFVKGVNSGGVSRVSVDSDGEDANGISFAPALSATGAHVVFASDATNLVPNDTNGCTDIFFRHEYSWTTTRISVSSDGEEANDNSRSPDISDDGRYIVFYTTATNLVSGTDGSLVALVHDRTTGRTELVTSTVDHEPTLGLSLNPMISGNGRFIVVESYERNLFIGAPTTAYAAVFANPLRPL